MKNKTTTWETKCENCDNLVYYYPSKLLIETSLDEPVNMNKRLISLTCCGGCNKMSEYKFPESFKEI